jgi:NTP pyrophosphatase (non-canonical NTP hydrolase)
MNLTEQVKHYYEKRELKHPNVWEALGFVATELGEVYEVLMSMVGGWVRNNPEKHPQKTKNDLAEELGDVIFMLIVAGIEEGVDPIEALREKMKRKLYEQDKTLQGVSKLLEVTEEDLSGN